MTAECMRKLVLVSAARRLRRSAAEQAAGEASNCEVLLQDVLAVEAEEALAMAGARHCLSTPAPPRECCAVSKPAAGVGSDGLIMPYPSSGALTPKNVIMASICLNMASCCAQVP